MVESEHFGVWSDRGDLNAAIVNIDRLAKSESFRKDLGEAGYRFLLENYTVDKSVDIILDGLVMYKHYFKRFIDFCIALAVLLCIAWFLIIVAIWLHFANKGAGAFFFQERPGKNGKIFKVVKFKTMTDERDADGKLLPDAVRLTKVGKFVRSTSIDELPQLWNVLVGDMALIGPRPLLVEYLPLYSPEQARRHEVRPGISGWAQCHGRNAISWTEKFKLDVWYVDHVSLVTDLKVIFITIKKVLMRSDISQEGSATMPKFDGTN